MKLLGLDIETGGDFNKPLSENFIIEIGCVLWDTYFNTPVEIYNSLIKTDLVISK
jgi:DNA polymerase-3 subunit epsilon